MNEPKATTNNEKYVWQTPSPLCNEPSSSELEPGAALTRFFHGKRIGEISFTLGGETRLETNAGETIIVTPLGNGVLSVKVTNKRDKKIYHSQIKNGVSELML